MMKQPGKPKNIASRGLKPMSTRGGGCRCRPPILVMT